MLWVLFFPVGSNPIQYSLRWHLLSIYKIVYLLRFNQNQIADAQNILYPD